MCISSSSKLKTHKKCFNWTHLCAFWIPLQFHRHLRLFLHNPNLYFEFSSKSFKKNRLKTRDEKTQPILWVFIQIFAKRKDLKPFSFSSCSQPPGLLRLHLHCKYLPFPCIRYQTGIIFNIKYIFVILFWMCCS